MNFAHKYHLMPGHLIIPIAILLPQPASAHVSEQGFVLLLPTGLYTIAGAAAVAITFLVIALIPASVAKKLFLSRNTKISVNIRFAKAISLVSTGLLWALIFVGFWGPHDPLENLLPLVIWTLWWQGFLLLQALFGNLWHWLNPWTGIYCTIMGSANEPGILRLPPRLGTLPGIVTFACFGLYLLVDLAPDNPARLAVIVAVYWFYTLLGMIIFGANDWLARAECFTMLLRKFALLSPFAINQGKIYIGFPGWRMVETPKPSPTPNHSLTIGIFAIIILATGSFDGLNETFWWLGNIGINPLEFPGRSAVIWPNMAGLVAAQILLPACFAILIFIGLKLANPTPPFRQVFATFALCVLPIAIGYHFSHYLTAFMVNIQYTIAAFSDPFETGADYLNLGRFYVTSGFLNSHDTVKIIWLLQAAFVVGGHMIAVLLSHALALKMTENPSKATFGQLPLALFMIAYTVFGLWLLATPRGI
jgi:hypothetical protein